MLGVRADGMMYFGPRLELLFLPASWPEVSPLLPPLVAVEVTYPHYYITPLASHNGHLSSKVTFFSSQCGRCEEVQLRNNFVFVPNRLPSLFTRWPEMTRPSPQKSALWEWDTQSFLGVLSIVSSFFDIEERHFSIRRWRLPQRGAQ